MKDLIRLTYTHSRTTWLFFFKPDGLDAMTWPFSHCLDEGNTGGRGSCPSLSGPDSLCIWPSHPAALVASQTSPSHQTQFQVRAIAPVQETYISTFCSNLPVVLCTMNYHKLNYVLNMTWGLLRGFEPSSSFLFPSSSWTFLLFRSQSHHFLQSFLE